MPKYQNAKWRESDTATESMGRRARESMCEIFYVGLSEQSSDTCFWDAEENAPRGEGWYYWCCIPGCLPEGDPMGPFATSTEAFLDAEENGFIREENEEGGENEEE